MRRQLTAVAAGALLAMIVVFSVTPGSWTHYRFLTNRFDFDAEFEGVVASLRQFSANMAIFYMTGGPTEELNVFPAEKGLKRRILIDIKSLMQQGVILVPDRDTTLFREITFLDPVHAVAVADEDWFLAYQDAVMRRPLSTKKLNQVTVRYYLKKQWGRWIVLDYNVFGRDDELPAVPVEKIVRW